MMEQIFIENLVRCAKKEFFDEWGEFDFYDLQDQKDYFRACMNVVSYIVSQFCSSDGIEYFDSLYDSELNYYFGGKKK